MAYILLFDQNTWTLIETFNYVHDTTIINTL